MVVLLIWAVDGGGTKTYGILADETGHVLAAHVGGPCNLSNQGAEGCTAGLAAVLNAVCAQIGVQRAAITHAFLALGGLDTEVDRQIFAGIVGQLFSGCPTKWQVENDVLAALYSGTYGLPGMVLLAGTGSMAMGLDVQGHLARAGGWGFMIGADPGSAFSIGRQVLVRALKEFDGGHTPSALTKRALAEVGVEIPPQLVDWVEEFETPPTRVAQMARVAADAAATGDPDARKILEDAAADMVAHLHLLYPRLDFTGMSVVPVVLTGGMTRSAIYLNTMKNLIAQAGSPWQPVIPVIPPVGGAYVGALRLAGMTVSEEMVEKLAAALA